MRAAPLGSPLGETWSRPVIGRIKVIDSASPTADAGGFDDRYVAIFGGGFDPSFTAGDDVATKLGTGAVIQGRAFYVVDIETGAILYKMQRGVNGAGATVDFAPMPAAPSVADYNDDGYLDVAYIGDVNGQMWRIDLTPDASSTPMRGEIASGQLHGYEPFLLFDGCEVSGTACSSQKPIFFEPGIVFVGGSGAPPLLGIAFGTGNRAELARPNVAVSGLLLRRGFGPDDEDLREDRPARPDAALGIGVRRSVHRPLHGCRQWLPTRLRLLEREDDVDHLLDAGLPLPGDVHAGFGFAVRHQRRLRTATGSSS